MARGSVLRPRQRVNATESLRDRAMDESNSGVPNSPQISVHSRYHLPKSQRSNRTFATVKSIVSINGNFVASNLNTKGTMAASSESSAIIRPRDSTRDHLSRVQVTGWWVAFVQVTVNQ